MKSIRLIFAYPFSISMNNEGDLKSSHPSQGIIATREGTRPLAGERREQQHEEDYKGLAVAPIHQLSLSLFPTFSRPSSTER